MRPPVCEVCDLEFDPAEGASVRFSPRPQDTEWRNRAQETGMVGHPPDTGWFCPHHAGGAQALFHLQLAEAVALLRAELDATASEPIMDGATPMVWIKCHPTPARELYDRLVAVAPDICRALGIEGELAFNHTTSRDWTPMDRTVPPNCPYVDYRNAVAQVAGIDVAVSLDEAHWDDDNIGTAGARLVVGRPASDGTYMRDRGGWSHSIGGRWQTTPVSKGFVTELGLSTPLDSRLLPIVSQLTVGR